ARYVATITMSIGWRVCVITVLGQRADRGRLADERAHPDADVSLVPAWRQLEYGPFEIALPRGDRRGKNGFGVEVFPRAVGIRVQPEAAVRPVDARPVVHDGLHAAVVEHVHGGALENRLAAAEWPVYQPPPARRDRPIRRAPLRPPPRA